MRTRLRPYLLLAGLCLLFFHDLALHSSRVLYADHSDLIDLHIPAKRFLVRSLQETGELPLWCPHQLAGAPFLHDIQAGIFYPPHALLYLVPEEAVGPALSWLVVLHVLIAGWGMFAYARSQGLGELGALVAAVGYMFAGRWLLHLLAGGHYVVVGLAWLPLVILLLEQGIRRGGITWATLAGMVYAAMILGTQPQWTFYASLFLAVWTLGTALDRAGRWGARPGLTPLSMRRALVLWALGGLWMALIGVGLTAVQLWPTAEAAGLALRSAGLGSSGALDGGLRSLLFLVGPALSTEPHNLEWEDRGGLTLLWLASAVLAGLAGRGRLRFQAFVALALAAFAVGGSALVEGLPGFRMFRQPPRMFLIVGFPLALLAGHATEMLFTDAAAPETAQLARKVLLRLLVAVGILVGGYALRSWVEGRPLRGHVYWLSLGVTVPAALALLGRSRRASPAAGWAWAGLLLTDLWALTAPLVDTRPPADLYHTPACLAPLVGRPLGQGRILDISASGNTFPLGGGAPLARLDSLESLRGYNPLDYRRYKQYLHFVGGSAEPLLAMKGPLTFPVLGNFPVVHKSLLDLLNTRWLLQPTDARRPDGWGEPLAVDWAPRTYNFLAGGSPVLPPYALYENPTVVPRSFVVFRASPLPATERVLDALTTTDLRQEVLLEGEVLAAASSEDQQPRGVSISRYEPNRVDVLVGDGPAGWLVLTDLWYPGWRCSVEGVPSDIRRANYLLRAVWVPAGRRAVAFAFEPESYRRGRLLSLATLVVVAALLALAALMRLLRSNKPDAKNVEPLLARP
jgi:hypothetical protein